MGRLAKPGDAYVTPKGEVHVQNHEGAQDKLRNMSMITPVARTMAIHTHRNMNEMPSTDPSTQTALNAILMYHLLGLTENEIAHMLRIEVVVVQNLMASSDFQATWEMIFHEIISINSGSLQATLSAHAHGAIERIVDLSKQSKHEMVKLKANQDLADRAGLHHDTLYGKNATNEEDSSLKISFVKENDKESIEIDISRGK